MTCAEFKSDEKARPFHYRSNTSQRTRTVELQQYHAMLLKMKTSITTMKTSITTMLLIVAIVFNRLQFSAAGVENYTSTVWNDCGNNTVAVGAFKRNLDLVLESLVSNVYPSGFNSSRVVVEGQNSNSSVYGRVQCRGDLGSSDCKQCASMAKAQLVEGCHNTSGSIQLNGCVLRYDNHSFLNDLGRTPRRAACDTGTSTQSKEFINVVVALLSNIVNTATQSRERFSAEKVAAPSNSTEYIYSIAECWRDMSPRICGSCLAFASSHLLNLCPTGALGAQFWSDNCYLRYEVYEFFNTSILTAPAPAPSVEESPPVSESKSRSMVLGLTLGIVAAAVGVIAAIGFWKWNVFFRTKGHEEGEVSLLHMTISNPDLIFKYEILKHATSNFSAENKLGEGGFGSVFKGVLPDGREVAVKRLYMSSRQGNVEFLNEANLISRVQHRNLVKLLGYSVESSERLLVYEYLQNGSLDKILFDTTTGHLLNWRERHEIIVGTARGLAYLHEESDIRIIHRDIKASNILLDDKHRAKIADFGLAKFFAEDLSHVSTRVAGTLGYMAPEYALRGQLTEKADVFSFGVLVLEIISGRKNQTLAEETEFLIERAWRLYNTENPLEVIDPTLEEYSYSLGEGIKVIKIGLLCTQAAAALRPSMSRVVSMLTSEREHISSPTRPAFVDMDSVLGAPDRVRRGRVTPPRDPDNTGSSSTQSSEAATYSRTSNNIPSAAADPSSSILEPR